MLSKIQLRIFVSLSLLLFFFVMLTTSVLMFTRQHNTTTALMHTLLGSAMLLLIVWHLKNNFAALKQHVKLRFHGRSAGFNLALPIALTVVSALAISSFFHFRPFMVFYAWGSTLRAGDMASPQNQFTYLRVNTTPQLAAGVKLTIDLRTGPYFAWPQYAFWLETLDGEFIQPLYVTGKLASNNFNVRVERTDESLVFTSNPLESAEYDGESLFRFIEEPETAEQRMRPESLPVFLHKAMQRDMAPGGSLDGSFDAYTGATIVESFLLRTQTQKATLQQYRLRFEINQSFDFNSYYSSNRFPDDPIYSGNGYGAQPSVVYETIIDPGSNQRYYPMKIIGRGHHSGKDGKIYSELNNMTTALEIVDRIIIEIDG